MKSIKTVDQNTILIDYDRAAENLKQENWETVFNARMLMQLFNRF